MPRHTLVDHWYVLYLSFIFQRNDEVSKSNVNDLFTVDTSMDMKKGASSSVRKGIRRAELAPVTIGKSVQHVKLIKKVAEKLPSKVPEKKKKVDNSATDVWADHIELGSSKSRIQTMCPESIPYKHVPSVPLPKHFEAFNPNPDELISALTSTAKAINKKAAQAAALKTESKEVKLEATADRVAEIFTVKKEADAYSESEEEDEPVDLSDDEDQKKRQKKVEMIKAGFDGRKTKAQRMKEDRYKTLLHQQALNKIAKKGLAVDISAVVKELKQKEKQHAEKMAEKTAEEAARMVEESTGVVHKPKKIGKQIFREAPVAVPLPSDILEAGGSLRRMRLLEQAPVANAMSERFISAQRRGVISASPDVISQDYARRKRKDIYKAKRAVNVVQSNRQNYEEAHL